MGLGFEKWLVDGAQALVGAAIDCEGEDVEAIVMAGHILRELADDDLLHVEVGVNDALDGEWVGDATPARGDDCRMASVTDESGLGNISPDLVRAVKPFLCRAISMSSHFY